MKKTKKITPQPHNTLIDEIVTILLGTEDGAPYSVLVVNSELQREETEEAREHPSALVLASIQEDDTENLLLNPDAKPAITYQFITPVTRTCTNAGYLNQLRNLHISQIESSREAKELLYSTIITTYAVRDAYETETGEYYLRLLKKDALAQLTENRDALQKIFFALSGDEESNALIVKGGVTKEKLSEMAELTLDRIRDYDAIIKNNATHLEDRLNPNYNYLIVTVKTV